MHFTMMFVFLIWLFWRHREAYRPVRQVMAWTTLACLAVQTLLPTAPPRMLPGIVDTGLRYNQSVYANGFAADQLSAMPSVHVAWCVLIGWYGWKIGGSRWRYLAVAHAALTTFVVVATGNHWWLDGIVAVDAARARRVERLRHRTRLVRDPRRRCGAAGHCRELATSTR